MAAKNITGYLHIKVLFRTGEAKAAAVKIHAAFL